MVAIHRSLKFLWNICGLSTFVTTHCRHLTGNIFEHVIIYGNGSKMQSSILYYILIMFIFSNVNRGSNGIWSILLLFIAHENLVPITIVGKVGVIKVSFKLVNVNTCR